MAIALTATACIVLMAVLVAWSMRTGFSQYIAQAELDRFNRLVLALEETYDPQRPGWPELTGRRRLWHEFTTQYVPRTRRRPPRHEPPRHRNENASNGGGNFPGRHQSRRPFDPLQLSNRLSLLDANSNWIAGANSDSGIAARRPVEVEGENGSKLTVGWVALSALENRPLSADAVFLRRQSQTIVISALLALFLSGISAVILARQFIAPIKRLGAGARRLASRDYSARMDNGRGDEFGRLIDDFNLLAETLEAADKKERQWLSDTSHELQTPVAVLRAGIEAIQDGVRKPTKSNLAELHGSVMSLTALIADIRTLTQASENQLIGKLEVENLADILRDSAEPFALLFEKAGLAFDIGELQPILVNCDRLRLRQVFDNLFENARRYTQSPGKVKVAVTAISDRVTIAIEDSAPHPPEEAMPKLFERFYRVDQSRSRERGGSGLGLSICKAIIEAQNGTITAAPSTIGGLRVEVSLPIFNEVNG